MKQLRISFDIGGVLTKRPDVFRPMIEALIKGGAEVFVITPSSASARTRSGFGWRFGTSARGLEWRAIGISRPFG